MKLLRQLCIVMTLLGSSSVAWADWTLTSSPCAQDDYGPGYYGCATGATSGSEGQYVLDLYTQSTYSTSEPGENHIVAYSSAEGSIYWAETQAIYSDPIVGVLFCEAGYGVVEGDTDTIFGQASNFCEYTGLDLWANVIVTGPNNYYVNVRDYWGY